MPQLAAALARGELSYSKARALTRVATPETEARLLAVGRAGTAAHVERIVRAWRAVDRQVEAQEAAARHARRSLQVYPDEDGMVVVRGRLEPEAGALLLRALEAARAALYARGRATAAESADADPPTHGQRQADALALVAETALQHALDPGSGNERYQVVVHVDAAVLADPDQPGQSALEDGVHVSAETSRRLGCDATRVVMRDAGDGPSSISGGGRGPSRRRSGGRSRPGTAGVASRAAGCPTPRGITSTTTGPTAAPPGSTTSRSSAGGIIGRSTRRATGSSATPTAPFASARRAAGRFPRSRRHRRCRPTRCRPSSRPIGRTASRSTRRTGCPSWLGERLDLAWAIDVLHPAANPVAPRPAGRSP